jgi:YfiH family protein
MRKCVQDYGAKSRISPDRQLIQSLHLSDYSWLAHGSTTRLFPHVSGDRGDDVRKLRESLNVRKGPVFIADQKHTSNVAVADPAAVNKLSRDDCYIFPETDAIVCTVPEVSIAVFTADCLPIFIVSPRRRTTALIHAGWRGTIGRIATRAVECVCSTGVEVSDIDVWIGPAIAPSCYEVSPDLISLFVREFADASEAGITFAQGRMLNLEALNVFQLIASGVTPDRIHTSGMCTLHQSDLLHSYRAAGLTAGRIISLITMRESHE